MLLKFIILQEKLDDDISRFAYSERCINFPELFHTKWEVVMSNINEMWFGKNLNINIRER